MKVEGCRTKNSRSNKSGRAHPYLIGADGAALVYESRGDFNFFFQIPDRLKWYCEEDSIIR